ncbi:MAG: DAK2 domain-containing protein [Coriobacteriales bacterium]|jgi:DAK2 domain fusion protein YloV|nr:DAK2 domain-containing protein [Coriobacteriales bacterium]
MQIRNYINAIELAYQVLEEQKEEVNRMNVFPVPDGDTGTNMALTMRSVVDELKALDEVDVAGLAKSLSHGSLMGARGNSGVILSQILRGIGDALGEHFDAETIAKTWQSAQQAAFAAVATPVQGTILTVVDDLAKASVKLAKKRPARDEMLAELVDIAWRAVKRTPKLLAVLRENNVVDSGAFGLAILLEAFTKALAGEREVGSSVHLTQALAATGPKVEIEQLDDWFNSKYLYCTEFLVHSDEVDVEAVRKYLHRKGDSELMVGEGPEYKVHVHTDDPGSVLSFMTKRGQVYKVFIHNMKLQADERNLGLSATEDKPREGAEAKAIGLVAVAMGAGQTRLLKEMGVDQVVFGGQTANPSIQDILQAIEAVEAAAVIVLPNNKNIVMAAEQAAKLASAKAAVVPTANVAQAFSALTLYGASDDFDLTLRSMQEQIKSVHTAEVTHATKSARTEKGAKIAAGDTIGIVDGRILYAGKDLQSVALKTAALLAADADLITLLAGSELRDEDFQQLVTGLAKRLPELEVDAQRGDQPLYPLVMSAE